MLYSGASGVTPSSQPPSSDGRPGTIISRAIPLSGCPTFAAKSLAARVMSPIWFKIRDLPDTMWEACGCQPSLQDIRSKAFRCHVRDASAILTISVCMQLHYCQQYFRHEVSYFFVGPDCSVANGLNCMTAKTFPVISEIRWRFFW